MREKIRFTAIFLLLLIFGLGPASGQPAENILPTSVLGARLDPSFGNLQLTFEKNIGQFDGRVSYAARSSGYTALLSQDGIELALQSGVSRISRVAISLAGSTAGRLEAGEAVETRSHYYVGNDPVSWITDVPHFREVRQKSALEGIDLRYYGSGRLLEFDFEIHPGANSDEIVLAFEGVGEIVFKEGDVLLSTADGAIRLREPSAYQQDGSFRHKVAVSYVQLGSNEIGFTVPHYDREKSLVIDPVLEYATALGAGDFDQLLDLKVDNAGNIYVLGHTNSENFPITVGALDTIPSRGDLDYFVAKLDANGKLLFSTFFGGSGDDGSWVASISRKKWPGGLALGPGGTIVFAGKTESPDLPTTVGAYDRICGNDGYCDELGGVLNSDGFVARLSADGKRIEACSYFGGNQSDWVTDIAVDAGGKVYLTGSTLSDDLPVTENAWDRTCGTDGTCQNEFAIVRYDSYLAVLASDFGQLEYASFIGGSDHDLVAGIAVDAGGAAVIIGGTRSPDFPTVNAMDSTCGATGLCRNNESAYSYSDLFLAKISPASGITTFSTYIGGVKDESPGGVGIGPDGSIYITGATESEDFPITQGAFQSKTPVLNTWTQADAFVTKLSPAGTLRYSTYLGGGYDDEGFGIVIDDQGSAYVVGETDSRSFPTTPGTVRPVPLDPSRSAKDGFLAKLNGTGSALTLSTLLGGSADEQAFAVALGPGKQIIVGGVSGQWPIQSQDTDAFRSVGTDSLSPAGGQNGFLTSLSPTASSVIFTTFLGGGPGFDGGSDLAVSPVGEAVVVGESSSAKFPTTSGGFDSSYNGGGSFVYDYRGAGDGFVSKIRADGRALTYSTYFGGALADRAFAVAVDDNGHAFVTGFTGSNDFPTTSGAFDKTCSTTGDCRTSEGSTKSRLDAFAARFDAVGKLVYSTYLGGEDHDFGTGIDIDGSGNAYVLGTTASDEFPVTASAYQKKIGSYVDAFVSKVSSDGRQLLYSTYLGGNKTEMAVIVYSSYSKNSEIRVDPQGNAFIFGSTSSPDFPVTPGAYQTQSKGGAEGFIWGGEDELFVTKLNPTGSALVYSTFLGGAGFERARGLYVDAGGNAYLAGETASKGFPVTAGAFQTGPHSNFRIAGFLSKLNANGTQLLFSTYFDPGSNSTNHAAGVGPIFLTSMGDILFGANVDSGVEQIDPLAETAALKACEGYDSAILGRFNPNATQLLMATCFNVSELDMDRSGALYALGGIHEKNPIQTRHTESSDAMVSKLSLRSHHLSVIAGQEQVTQAASVFSTPIRIRVVDDLGRGVDGIGITFYIPRSRGASGSFYPGGADPTKFRTSTADGGYATAPPIEANAELGTFSVGVIAETVGGTTWVRLSVVPGSPAALSRLSSESDETRIGTSFESRFQAQAKDRFGHPVSGVDVLFSGPEFGPGGTFGNGSPRTVIQTDAEGRATAPDFTANLRVGSYDVTAVVGELSTSFRLTNLPGEPDSISLLSGGSQAAETGEAFQHAISVQVVDEGENQLEGVEVVFSTPETGPTALFPDSTHRASATTDGTGVATSPLLRANDLDGRYEGTATVSGLGTVVPFALENLFKGKILLIAPRDAIVGSQVNVPILLSDGSSIGGLSFSVAFDPAVVEVQRVFPGPLLTGSSIDWQPAGIGKVELRFAAGPGSLLPPTGGAVAVLVLKVLESAKPGSSYLRLSAVSGLSDQGQGLRFSAVDGTLVLLAGDSTLIGPLLVFPHHANGEIGGQLNRSRVILRDRSGNGDTGQLIFRNQVGAVVETMGYFLHPWGTLEYSTTGRGNLRVGPIEVVSESAEETLAAPAMEHPTLGALNFEILGNFVSVQDSPVRTSQQLYVSRTKEEQTGVALFNPSASEPLELDLYLLDNRGRLRASARLKLNPLQHIARFVGQQGFFTGYFTEHPGDFKGTLNIHSDSGQAFPAIGLIQKTQDGALIAVEASGTAFRPVGSSEEVSSP